MRTLELAVLYGVIGAGSAAALVLHARGASVRLPLLDAAILVPFWPLYAPFLLMRCVERAPAPGADGAALEASWQDVVAARIGAARERVLEIDRLLGDPAFDDRRAAERERELGSRGDERAARAAGARLENIRRLKQLRGRFQRELTEVDELCAQLRVQSELVRLSGAKNEDSGELVAELMGRAEGLDAILTDDDDLGAPSAED